VYKKRIVSFLAGILAAVALLSLIPGQYIREARAATSSEIKEQIEEMEKEKKELEAQIKELKKQQSNNKSDMKAMVALKSNLDQQVGLLYSQINNMNQQIIAYSLLIADKQDELTTAEKRLEELNKKYKERIRTMEEDGSLSYWSVLFKANSFSDFLDRLNMVQEIATSDQRRLKELNKAAEAVEQAKAELETEKLALEEMRSELENKQADLEKQSAEALQVLSELVALGDEYRELVDQYEEEQENYIDELEKLEKEYDAQKYKEHMATATTAPKPTGSGNGGKPKVDENGITWLIPCTYSYVSSAWGYRTHPVTGKPKTFHNGVDLAGPGINGREIYATRDGVVTFSGWIENGGWTVKINHGDGYSSVYMHMSKRTVKAGDYVVAGQVIGNVGASGRVTGPHLHFEIRKNGSSVNPMEFIG